jgi:hypothetical protein
MKGVLPEGRKRSRAATELSESNSLGSPARRQQQEDSCSVSTINQQADECPKCAVGQRARCAARPQLPGPPPSRARRPPQDQGARQQAQRLRGAQAQGAAGGERGRAAVPCPPRSLPTRRARCPRSWRRSWTTCGGSRRRWRASCRSWSPTAAAAAWRSATCSSSWRCAALRWGGGVAGARPRQAAARLAAGPGPRSAAGRARALTPPAAARRRRAACSRPLCCLSWRCWRRTSAPLWPPSSRWPLQQSWTTRCARSSC